MHRAFGLAAVACWALSATQQTARSEIVTLDFTVNEPVNMDVSGLVYSQDGFQIWGMGPSYNAASELRPTFGGSWFFYAEDSFNTGFMITHESGTFNFRSFDVLALGDFASVAFYSERGAIGVSGGGCRTEGCSPGNAPGTYTVEGWQWHGLSWLGVAFEDYSFIGTPIGNGAYAYIDNIVLFVPSPSAMPVALPALALACIRRRRGC